jgi:hypothetical protein
MKQTTVAAGLMVACAIGTPAAQRTEPPTPATEPAHNVYLMSGCLERGDAPTSFRLTRAKAVGQAPPRPSASPAWSRQEDEAYELQATSSVSEQGLSSEKLQPEVGRRVEMTIRPVEAVSAAPSLPVGANPEEKPVRLQRYTVIKLDRLGDFCK